MPRANQLPVLQQERINEGVDRGPAAAHLKARQGTAVAAQEVQVPREVR